MDDAMDCLMSFSDFLFAFQIQFYYSGESLPGSHVGSCQGHVCLSYPGVLSICCLARTFPPPPLPSVACFTTGHRQDVSFPLLVTRFGLTADSLSLLETTKAMALPASARQIHLSDRDSH